MTVLVLGALVVAAGGGCLWWMRSHVVGSRSGIDQRIDALMTERLQDAREHMDRSQTEHACHVDTRIRRAEDTVARIVDGQARLDQRLEVVETWVRHWAQQVES